MCAQFFYISCNIKRRQRNKKTAKENRYYVHHQEKNSMYSKSHMIYEVQCKRWKWYLKKCACDKPSKFCHFSRFRQIAAIAESKILIGATLSARRSASIVPRTLKMVLKWPVCLDTKSQVASPLNSIEKVVWSTIFYLGGPAGPPPEANRVKGKPRWEPFWYLLFLIKSISSYVDINWY